MTETNGELCRQYQKSAASAAAELNDRPYQKLLTDPEGLEELGHRGRQPGESESTHRTASNFSRMTASKTRSERRKEVSQQQILHQLTSDKAFQEFRENRYNVSSRSADMSSHWSHQSLASSELV